MPNRRTGGICRICSRSKKRLAAEDRLAEVVLPLASALGAWPQAVLEEAQLARIRQGQAVPVETLEADGLSQWPPQTEETPVAVLDVQGDVCAVARVRAQQLQPVKVFSPS